MLRNGPQVEYACPPFPSIPHDELADSENIRTSTSTVDASNAIELPEEWAFLPFLCLPDGAHATEEEFIYFHLPPVPSWTHYPQSTLFGLACYRQIAASELLTKSQDVTRSTVQKAVVVLSTQPILGSVRSKLGLVTRAFFEQKDFTKLEILETLYQNLCVSMNWISNQVVEDSILYMGLSLRDLVWTFRQKTLQLFKLLLLEKRILFFGTKVERLSGFQYSLVSLIPDLLRNLQDAGSPSLGSHSRHRASHESHRALKPNTVNALNAIPPSASPQNSSSSLSENLDTPVTTPPRPNKVRRSTSHARAQSYHLPLHIFGNGSFFQPYIPLQQVDILTHADTKSFLVGTSNSIFLWNKSIGVDAVANVETGTLEIVNPALNALLNLTPPDKRFIDDIVKSVSASYTPTSSTSSDPQFSAQLSFAGSDDDIRNRFEQYLCSMLVSVKSEPIAKTSVDPNMRAKEWMTDWNTAWVRAWQGTRNYHQWMIDTALEDSDDSVDDRTCVLSNPLRYPTLADHPCKGANTLTNLQAGLWGRWADFRSANHGVEQKVGEKVKEVGKGLEIVGKAVSEKVESVGKVVGEKVGEMGKDEWREEQKERLQATTSQLFLNVSSFIAQKRQQWSGAENETDDPSHEGKETENMDRTWEKEGDWEDVDIKSSKERLDRMS
ncbi:transport protein Avl9-domain-containing protein [Gaertneriomyces semiglobifer]|nr:transport protein Avl9-domain-containing protein [Gaertneriomyces semiglobifer]